MVHRGPSALDGGTETAGSHVSTPSIELENSEPAAGGHSDERSGTAHGVARGKKRNPGHGGPGGWVPNPHRGIPTGGGQQ